MISFLAITFNRKKKKNNLQTVFASDLRIKFLIKMI